MSKPSAPAAEYPANIPFLDNAGWRDRYDKLFTPNYGARRLALVRGEGTRVWDADGNEYLDFLTGISVNNLGHCHPRITAAIREQAATLVHCSNHYYIPQQIELAQMLIDHSFADRLVFGNSGAEANEAAIKIARRWQKETRGPGHHEIISFTGSFHGRTLATLTATGQEKVKLNFDPLPEGFVHAEYNNLDSVRAALSDRTGAILVEPITGEGGIHIATNEFLRGLRELCDERGLLLIFDEIQCGLGRTGTLFAYEQYGVEPDIMTLAKSLGGGLAMGVMLCTEAVAGAFAPGAHGSTMAGNPLTAAAGRAYLAELIEGGWPGKARRMGEKILQRLRETTAGMRRVKEVRGRGLMLAVELTDGAPDVLLACERAGLLVNVTAGQVVRLLPPLNVSEAEVERALAILVEAIATAPAAAGGAA